MKRVILAALVASLMLGANLVAGADKPADKSAEVKTQPKAKYRPFNGKIKATDASSITLQGAKAQTFQVTSATKIQKDGKPAVIADVKVGDSVGGRAREMADGKWEVLTLNVGTKAAKKPAEKPKKEETK